MPQMLCVYDFSLTKPKQIIISGKRDDELTREMLRTVHSRFIPNKILIFAETGKDNTLIPYLSQIVSQSGKATAYVCENYSCKLPTSNIDELRKLLEE